MALACAARPGLAWKTVRSLVRTVPEKAPGQDVLEDAVARVDVRQHTPEFKKSGIAKTSYANCGRASMLTPAQKKAIVDFVKRWSRRCDWHGAGSLQDL